MADKDHVRRIREGVETWNDWRRANPYEHPDLEEADLKGVELSGANLRVANLRHACLEDANVENAVLVGADLRAARLKGLRCSGAKFRNEDTGAVDVGGLFLVLEGIRRRIVVTIAADVSFKEASVIRTALNTIHREIDGTEFATPPVTDERPKTGHGTITLVGSPIVVLGVVNHFRYWWTRDRVDEAKAQQAEAKAKAEHTDARQVRANEEAAKQLIKFIEYIGLGNKANRRGVALALSVLDEYWASCKILSIELENHV